MAFLYLWEVDQQGLVARQVAALIRGVIAVPRVSEGLTHAVFFSHVILICLMVAASFIDIDEKIIPDEITIPGTLLGLLLATLLPISLLPHVVIRKVPPVVGELVVQADEVALYAEPLTASAPHAWPESLEGWPALVLAQACWWLWCCCWPINGPWRCCCSRTTAPPSACARLR